MICTILICAGIAAYYGANVTFSIEERLRALEKRIDIPVNGSLSGLQKPYSYIISQVDTYTCIQDGTNGNLEYYSTIAANAITYAWGKLSNGGSVLIRAGDYLITFQMNVTYNGTETYGEGDATVLYAANGLNDNVIYAVNKTYLVFRNFKIDGNKANQVETPDRDRRGCGMFLTGCSHCTVDHVHVYQTLFHGIFVRDYGQFNTVSQCFVEQVGLLTTNYSFASGIVIFNGESHDTVTACNTYHNRGCGIYFSRLLSECSAVGNNINESTYGIHGSLHNCTGCAFVGNTIQSGTIAFELVGEPAYPALWTTITGNDLCTMSWRATGHYSLFGQYLNYTTFSGNTIHGFLASPIYLDSCKYTNIVGNQIYWTGTSTVVVVSVNSSDYTSICDNQFATARNPTISLVDTHYRIYGNLPTINLLTGKPVGTAFWNVLNPSDMSSTTDGNWDSAVTAQSIAFSAWSPIGAFQYDLGSNQTVQLSSKIGVWANTAVPVIEALWAWSYDNVTYYLGSGNPASSAAASSETISFTASETINARYIRLFWRLTDAPAIVTVKLYEIQAFQVG